ncbi:MAG: hypothetical protein IIZ61_02430, partial [Lachnospiraceae bacterium]|nr:hypothetical protein [Lachnospiraceae bacterium]
NAAYYRLCVAEDTYILSDRMIPVDRQFTYMSFLKSDLSNVYLELFDEHGEKIGDAKFDTTRKEIYNDIDEEAAEELAEKKRKEAEERAIREKEEARLREIQEQRDEVAALLRQLGLPTDDKSIDYAMKHMNELSYQVELLNAIVSLREEHSQAVAKYEAAKADPKTKPEDLRALADRVRITELMPDIYENTLGAGTSSYLEEIEKYRKAKLAALLAEYIALYNEKVEAEEGTDLSEIETRMAEIEEEVLELGSNVIAEFKEIVVPFEEALKRLLAIKSSDYETTDKIPDITNDIKTCNDCISKLENSEFAKMYSHKKYEAAKGATPIREIFGPRLGNAIYHVIKELGAKIDELNKNFNLTVYTIKKTDYQFADALGDFFYVLRDSCKEAYGTSYSNIQGDAERILKSIDNYVEAVEDIWRARMSMIISLNQTLSNNYDLLVPYKDFGDEYKNLDAEMKEKQKDLEAFAKELSVNEADMKEKKDAYDSYAGSYVGMQFFYNITGRSEGNLREEYLAAQNRYLMSKGRYEAANNKVIVLQEKYKKMTEMIYDYLGTMNSTRDECKEIIAEIERLDAEPDYTAEQVDKKYDEALGAVKDKFEEFLVAQYASNYNRANDPTAEAEEKQKSEEMMTDIEGQLKDLSAMAAEGSKTGENTENTVQTETTPDKLTAFKEAVAPFDTAVSELYNVTLEEILSQDDIASYLAAKYDPVLSTGNELMEKGYGYGYITRVDSAMSVGSDAVAARVDELKLDDAEALINNLETPDPEIQKLLDAATYYKSKLTFNVGEAARAIRILQGFKDGLSNVKKTKSAYVSALNKQLMLDESALRPQKWVKSLMDSYNDEIRRLEPRIEPLEEQLKELQEKYEKTVQAYCEYNIIYTEKVYPAKTALEEAEKSGNEEEIKKCRAAYDDVKEFEKELSDSKKKAEDLSEQILDIRKKMGEKGADYEKYVDNVAFLQTVYDDYDNKVSECYHDALRCIELINKLDGMAFYSEREIREKGQELGLK